MDYRVVETTAPGPRSGSSSRKLRLRAVSRDRVPENEIPSTMGVSVDNVCIEADLGC